MALKDGIFSAILRMTTGTFASPTAWVELDLLVGSINISWGITPTKSNARRTRLGDRFIDGQANNGTMFEATFEDDPADAQIIALRAAVAAGTAIVLAICPYKKAGATVLPPDDAPYIKGEYKVYGGSPDNNPGSPNQVKFQFCVALESTNAPVLVSP